MGRWGYQTHARDYYMDIIDMYGLSEDNQQFKENPTKLIQDTLSDLSFSDMNRWDKEMYLAIFSFLFQNHRGITVKVFTEERWGRKKLKRAFNFLTELINDIEFAITYYDGWGKRLKCLEEELKDIYSLLWPTKEFNHSLYHKIDLNETTSPKNWNIMPDDIKHEVIRSWTKSPPKNATKCLKDYINYLQTDKDFNPYTRDHTITLTALAL